MASSSEYDIGPLTWVKGEIDQALARAVGALRAASANPAESAQLRHCQTHFHQAYGALQIVGLDGVARYAEEIEGLLADLAGGTARAGASATAERAIGAISTYLEQVLAGQSDQPLKLFALYREVVELRGRPSPDPIDLYFPDLSKRGEIAERPAPGIDRATVLKNERARFMRGFLRWLRKDREGMREMHLATAAIRDAEPVTASRAFWTVAAALLDGVVQGALRDEAGVPRLLNRIERQIKRLIDGAPGVAERLHREVLFHTACAQPVTAELQSAQAAHGLAGTIPETFEMRSDDTSLLPRLRGVREAVGAAKSAWIKFAAGHVASHQPFAEQAASLRERARELGRDELAYVADEVVAAAEATGAGRGAPSEALALEVATALLLIEDAAERFATLPPEFPRQCEAMITRLRLARGEPVAAAGADSPLLDEMTRRAQERVAIAQVVAEIQTNLREIEGGLDAYFRDQGRRAELPKLEPRIAQVLGAFRILNETRAEEALVECATRIRRFGDEHHVPADGEFETLAAMLSGLGFYVDALQHGKADFDAAMRPIGTKRDPLTDTTIIESVETQLEQQKREMQSLIEAWQEAPDDPVRKDRLRRHIEAIQQDAVLVADAGLEKRAQEALALLARHDAQPEQAHLTDALASLGSGEAVVDQPSEESRKLASASNDEFDAEMLEIYLEEADEVLGTIGGQLDQVIEQPADFEALQTIRRGFHTLKGSGRMVGLTQISEAAWAVERVMNGWLERGVRANEDLLDLLRAGHRLFQRAVVALRARSPLPDEAPVVALAAAVEAGESVVMVGDRTLTRTLFQIFVGEARTHLATLRATCARLDRGDPLEEHDARAAHTMAGVCGSVGFDAPRALSSSLEGALDRLAGAAPDDQTRLTILDGVNALGGMIEEIAERESPQPAASVILRLDALAADTPRLVPEPHPADEVEPAVGSSVIAGTVAAAGGALVAAFVRSEPAVPDVASAPVEPEPEQEQSEALPLDLELDATFDPAPPAPASDEVIEEAAGDIAADPISSERPEPRDEVAPDAIAAASPAPASPHFVAPDAPLTLDLEVSQAAPPESAETVSDAAAHPASDALTLIPVPTAPPRAAAPLGAGGEDIDPQLLELFLEEGQELVPAIATTLRQWRTNPHDAAVGHALQRHLHTLKGGARMAGAMGLGELLHDMETRVENAVALSNLPLTLFDDLDVQFDRASTLFDQLHAGGGPAAIPIAGSADLAELEATPADEPAPVAAPDPTRVGAAAIAADISDAQAALAAQEPERAAMLRVRADVVDRLVNQAGEVAIARSRIEGEVKSLKASLAELTENINRLRGQLREIEIQAETQIQARLVQSPDTDRQFDPLEFDRFTRFQELTRMMAESVNDVAAVHQNIDRALDESDAALLAQARLSRDLQQDLLRVRMVPFKNVAERLYRVVRQAAKDSGKRATLDIRGSQVELDRSVLERITAPFEHMLRNSVAHGIEMPADRRAAGKTDAGEIRIELRQEGNEVMLEVSDDGRGLDLPRIRDKAIERGILDAAAEPTPGEIAELIFEPGFTTANEITQLAGRGVGMDVVKSEIGALGGRVEVSTEAGRGARFVVFLPLTLAVTQALIVQAGTAKFAIPGMLVEQVRQMREEEIAECYRRRDLAWQDRRIGFHYLARLLGDAQSVAESRRLSPVILVRSGTHHVAVHVDEIVGNQEIVVKNTGPLLQRVAGITGATVLGSGEIVLILNPVMIAARETVAVPVTVAPRVPQPEPTTAPMVMIVDDSLTVRKITGRLLTREGYQVVTARDGVDAIEQLEEHLPAAMVVDIEMPRMDGFDLTRHIRSAEKFRHIPIIMVTSRTATKHRTYAMEIGVNAFLGKPYRDEELLAAIAAHIRSGAAAGRTAIAH